MNRKNGRMMNHCGLYFVSIYKLEKEQGVLFFNGPETFIESINSSRPVTKTFNLEKLILSNRLQSSW